MPADAYPKVWLSEMPELVCDHDRDLPIGKATVDERVPENDAAARTEPGRLCIRQRGDVVHRLDFDRRVRHVLDPLQPGRCSLQRGLLQTVSARQPGTDERKEQRKTDER